MDHVISQCFELLLLQLRLLRLSKPDRLLDESESCTGALKGHVLLNDFMFISRVIISILHYF